MKKIGIILGLFLVGVFGIVASGATDLYISGKWRYKITVDIKTPDGIVSGSTIREVSHYIVPNGIRLPDTARGPKTKGEAVIIDLGDKGKVFGLISSDAYRELYETFPFRNGKKPGDGIKYYNSLSVGKKGGLPPREHPRFVVFENINDPMSLVVLEQGDFAGTLGDGYDLYSIAIEITDKPIHWKIGEVLPWLDDLGGSYLHGGSTSRDSPYGLHTGHFRTRR